MPDDRSMTAERLADPLFTGLTVDDYYRLAGEGRLADDRRFELLDGALFEMPPIGLPHALLVALVYRELARAAGDELFIFSQLPIRVSDRSEPQPDHVLLRMPESRYAQHLPGPNDALLVVEVSVTSLRYDATIKQRVYARAGIPEYWIVDAVAREIIRHRKPIGDAYTLVDRHAADLLPISGLARGQFDVRKLFSTLQA